MGLKKTKRLWAGLLAGLCLVAGLSAAASDSGQDALASLSYLTGTFLPALEKGMAERAGEGTRPVRDAALSRINGLGQRYAAGGQGGTQSPQPTVFSGGDTLTLEEGGSVIWLAGSGTAGPGLVDATAGEEVPANGTLLAGHRYLNGQEGAAVQITARSDKAQAAPAGRWTTLPGGQDVTQFYDIGQTDWFYGGVRWSIDQGIFNGMSTTQFVPGGTVNRAMLATLLHRLAGSPQLAYQGLFSDVPAGEWYTQGIEWAAANRIAEGSGEGTFSPGRAVSREEIAVMLYRCAGYLRLDTTPSGSLEGFYDSASVSPEARDAFSWAVGVRCSTAPTAGCSPSRTPPAPKSP